MNSFKRIQDTEHRTQNTAAMMSLKIVVFLSVRLTINNFYLSYKFLSACQIINFFVFIRVHLWLNYPPVLF